MSLSTIFRANLLRSPFSEAVAITLPDGTGRTITTIIDGVQRLDMGEQQVRDREEIAVTCYRVPDDPDVGGIDYPELKTKLLRAGDSRSYLWTGEKLEESAYHFVLKFARELQRQAGTVNTTR